MLASPHGTKMSRFHSYLLSIAAAAAVMSGGCSSYTSLYHSPEDRRQQLMEMAAEYTRSNRPEAAMRIYDHMLAQDAGNSTAKSLRDQLAQQGVDPRISSLGRQPAPSHVSPLPETQLAQTRTSRQVTPTRDSSVPRPVQELMITTVEHEKLNQVSHEYVTQLVPPSNPMEFDLETAAGKAMPTQPQESNPGPSELLSNLIGQLRSDSSETVCLAAYQLGQIGPGAIEAASELTELRDTQTGMVRLHATEALSLITPGDVVSVKILSEALRGDDAKCRWVAAMMLGNVSEPLRLEAAEALKTAVDDPNSTVAATACLSLGGLGLHGIMVLPELERASKSSNSEVSEAARIALRSLQEKFDR